MLQKKRLAAAAGTPECDGKRTKQEDVQIRMLTEQLHQKDAQLHQKDAQLHQKDAQLKQQGEELYQHCIDHDQRLVASFTSTAAVNSAEYKLVEASAKLANLLLSVVSVAREEIKIGVSSKGLKETPIKVEFHDPYTHFANETKKGTNKKLSKSERYAHAWTAPPNHNTIFVDKGLLLRYETESPKSGPEAQLERDRIEYFLAWKLLHELAHLGFRWANGQEAITPAKFGKEAGRYVETSINHGPLGLIFHKKGNALWNGSQGIVGLFVARSGGSPQRVREEYIQHVCRESRLALPKVCTLLPIELLPGPVESEQGHFLLSAPFTRKPARKSGPVVADGKPVPRSWGGNGKWVASFGKSRFGPWGSAKPLRLSFGGACGTTLPRDDCRPGVPADSDSHGLGHA